MKEKLLFTFIAILALFGEKSAYSKFMLKTPIHVETCCKIVKVLSRAGKHRIWGCIQSEDDSAYTNLKNLRIQNRNGLIISYLNINSIRSKIESLQLLISDNVDILIAAETKIDRTFPSS